MRHAVEGTDSPSICRFFRLFAEYIAHARHPVVKRESNNLEVGVGIHRAGIGWVDDVELQRARPLAAQYVKDFS